MHWLSVLFGGIVGVSLGLTGGGGAIFAVPLLVYGLAIPPRQAVGISLAAVGVTALLGFLQRWRARQVELRTGLIFAAAGMAGAPPGSWLAGLLPEPLLLGCFALLMLAVALRMWTSSAPSDIADPRLIDPTVEPDSGLACRRDPAGNLLLTSRCTAILLALGLATGILSGMFGVGGGFIIVPALVMFSGIPIHRAIGTSLMVIALVSGAGILSHHSIGQGISLSTTAWFVAGSVIGMFVGTGAGRRLSGSALQKIFAAAIVVVAGFVIYRSLAKW